MSQSRQSMRQKVCEWNLGPPELQTTRQGCVRLHFCASKRGLRILRPGWGPKTMDTTNNMWESLGSLAQTWLVLMPDFDALIITANLDKLSCAHLIIGYRTRIFWQVNHRHKYTKMVTLSVSETAISYRDDGFGAWRETWVMPSFLLQEFLHWLVSYLLSKIVKHGVGRDLFWGFILPMSGCWLCARWSSIAVFCSLKWIVELFLCVGAGQYQPPKTQTKSWT